MSDRFDLEQQILDCWKIVDELKLISERHLEVGMSRDEVSNLLIGIASLYNLKFDQMFGTFEQCLKKREL